MVGALDEEELVGLNVQQLEYRSDAPAMLVLSQLHSSLCSPYAGYILVYLGVLCTSRADLGCHQAAIAPATPIGS